MKVGSTQEKILLLLLSGAALSFTRSPKRHLYILKTAYREWHKIDTRHLKRAIDSLYKSHLVTQKTNRDNTVTFILTEDGKKRALSYNIETIEVKKTKWDKKWRLVMFDIPEKKKKIREAMRYHLRKLGFIEYQRSVFILPYECKDEIEYLVEFYSARKYVRYLVVTYLDNELDFKNKFYLK